MFNATPGSREIGQVLGYHGDGLLDIFLGLVLLDAWGVVRGGSEASSGGAIVILFPLLLVAKGAITVPRLPSGKVEPPLPSKRPKPLTLLLSAVVAVALVVLVATLPPSTHGGVGRVWEVVALAGLGCVAAAGLRLGTRRFVVYAAFTAVALVLALHGPPGLGAYLTPALAIGMVAWGGVMLARFLAARPRAA